MSGAKRAWYAADFVPLVSIPGLNNAPNLTSSSGIGLFLNNLYEFSIGIAVVLAIAMIIWGGTEYALSEAITSKGAGKKKVQQALYGLLLVLSPALVFSIINPEILKLDVNFPKLETAWGTYAEGSYTTVTPCDGDNCNTAGTSCNPSETPQYVCKNVTSGSVSAGSTAKPTCKTGEILAVECLDTRNPVLPN